METADYAPLVAAGAEGLVVYQETYDRETYARDAHRRAEARFRLAAGLPGARLRGGLPAHRHRRAFRARATGATKPLALAAHLEHLLRHCWKAQFTVRLPRLRPCAGEFRAAHPLTDREFVQLVCALRICFPQVGIVLSTREPAPLRDALLPLGVTMMSAGSHTEPGGYTGEGRDDLHLTVRGKPRRCRDARRDAECDRAIRNRRRPLPRRNCRGSLLRRGFEPVWKDWDHAILAR